jgi:hypothetical protein
LVIIDKPVNASPLSDDHDSRDEDVKKDTHNEERDEKDEDEEEEDNDEEGDGDDDDNDNDRV